MFSKESVKRLLSRKSRGWNGASVEEGTIWSSARDRRSRRCCTASLMSRTKGEAAGTKEEEEETEDNGEDDRKEKGEGRRIVSWWLEPLFRLLLSFAPSSFYFHEQASKAGLHTRRANTQRERERERREEIG